MTIQIVKLKVIAANFLYPSGYSICHFPPKVISTNLGEDHDVLDCGNFQGFEPYSNEPTVTPSPRQSVNESSLDLDSSSDEEVENPRIKELRDAVSMQFCMFGVAVLQLHFCSLLARGEFDKARVS